MRQTKKTCDFPNSTIEKQKAGGPGLESGIYI